MKPRTRAAYCYPSSLATRNNQSTKGGYCSMYLLPLPLRGKTDRSTMHFCVMQDYEERVLSYLESTNSLEFPSDIHRSAEQSSCGAQLCAWTIGLAHANINKQIQRRHPHHHPSWWRFLNGTFQTSIDTTHSTLISFFFI